MSAVADPRRLLAKYGLRARKSWGQHFLIEPRVYDAIVRATVSRDDDWIIEIGAGLGTLTARLADAVPRGRVIAVEHEPSMTSVLQAELGDRDNVEIAAQDVLSYDWALAARRAGKPLAIAGNLPYQIAAPILFALLDARAHFTHAVVMLQKEMADRLLAGPATRAYGALGVLVTTYADVRPVLRVRAGAFHPPPKVESTVVTLMPLPDGRPRFPLVDPARYAAVVHAAFGQRRKTLKNALRARFDPQAVEQALSTSGIDGSRRGETLALDELARLANALPRDADAGAA